MQAAVRPIKDLKEKLDISSVFRHGRIIHAFSDLNGTRIVSIEDMNLVNYDDKTTHYGSRKHAQQTAVGKGSTIEEALQQAVFAFQRGFSFDKMYARRKHPKGSLTHSSNLDRWLIAHKGKATILRDEDYSIICHLEGLKDTANPLLGHVQITGRGHNIRLALRNAFDCLEEAKAQRIHITAS